jgi:hypothetical protein
MRNWFRISRIANAVPMAMFLYLLVLNCNVGTSKGLAYTTNAEHCFGIQPDELGVRLLSAYPSDRPTGWDVFKYPWSSVMYNFDFDDRAFGFRWGKRTRPQIRWDGGVPFRRQSTITTWQLFIPLWIFFIAFGALPARYAYLYWRRRHRRTERLCVHCGYDLRMSEMQCPECGTPINGD